MIGNQGRLLKLSSPVAEVEMENENIVPNYYIDALRFTVQPYGVAFTFGVNAPHPSPSQISPSKDALILRMSLEHAKVLAMMLRKQLKTYEMENKLEIPLPAQLYTQLGIAREDWDMK